MVDDTLLEEIRQKNQHIVDMCAHVHRHLYRADKSHKTWEWISDNAEQINRSKYGLSFGMWQDMAVGEMISALGRVYDNDRRTNSLASLLRLAQTAPILNPSPLHMFSDAHKLRLFALRELSTGIVASKTIKQIVDQKPNPNNSTEIKIILNFRNNKVAHCNAMAAHYALHSNDIRFAINWGYSLIDAISVTYGNAHFEEGAVCPVVNLRGLANDLGILT